MPSFTFAVTAKAVGLTGAHPVSCDINPISLTLNVEHIESLISPRIRGIMPVHLFRHAGNMVQIMRIAAYRGIQVFEDAAQAHGHQSAASRSEHSGTLESLAFTRPRT